MKTLAKHLCCLLLAALCATATPRLATATSSPLAGQNRPRLVVVLVVDQMRADYLTRFDGLFTGGFARLMRQGAVFTEAHHDHAYTVTAVGHAAISTGAFPSHNGIVGNDWYDRASGKKQYSTEDSSVKILGEAAGAGQSPRNLRIAALGDWLKAASPRSKVFAIAFKDRASILMGGLHPDGAYWYGNNGRFVTSTYYEAAYPPWVDAFNASGLAGAHFADGWKKFLPEEDYLFSSEDRVAAENDGEHTAFPYTFDDGASDAKSRYYSEAIWATPFGDELSLEFAKALVAHERLGEDSDPDLLFVGCSTADVVGHRFGPLSQEIEDCYIRLDRKLGELFAYLDARVGARAYAVVLTSDHGVLPLPEQLQRRGFDAARVSAADNQSQIERAGADVARALSLERSPVAYAGADGVVLRFDESDARKIPRPELRQRMAERLKQIPFVADVFTSDELAAASGERRDFVDAYRHAYFAERSPDLLVRFRENYLVGFGAHGTSHGTPYRYDTHVPLVFAGPGVAPGPRGSPVRTVDLAPTVAAMLGLRPPPTADGRSLLDAIQRPPDQAFPPR